MRIAQRSDFDNLLSTIDSMKDEIVQLASDLIKIQSVNPKYPDGDAEKFLGGEKECNQFLARQLSDFGCEIDLFEKLRDRTNLVGKFKGHGTGRSIILNGHIDTVPFGKVEEWIGKDPLSGKVIDGKLYGRGACDMKSGIAAMCKAVEAISRSGMSLKGDVTIESVVGEETMDHLLGTTATVERGYRANAAIVCEPTSLCLEPVTTGVLLLTISVEGKAAHTTSRDQMIRPGGGGDEIGVNAIEKGVKVIEALQELERQWGITKKHPLFNPGHFVIHPGVIDGAPSGHRYVAVVPDYCKIDYAVLYNPSETIEQVKAEIEEYVLNASKLDTWLSRHPPKFNWWGSWPSGEISPSHPICESVKLGHAIVESEPVSGIVIKGMPAPVDVPFLDATGIPTIAYGPGDLPQAHVENEYVWVDQLVTATKVLAVAVADWCGFVSQNDGK
jgi:acetylornithine deacetylase